MIKNKKISNKMIFLQKYYFIKYKSRANNYLIHKKNYYFNSLKNNVTKSFDL